MQVHQLTTPENTTTYQQNALCLSPQNFAYALSSDSLWSYKMAPTETENNAYVKCWGDKQRALYSMLWYSLEWSITCGAPCSLQKTNCFSSVYWFWHADCAHWWGSLIFRFPSSTTTILLFSSTTTNTKFPSIFPPPHSYRSSSSSSSSSSIPQYGPYPITNPTSTQHRHGPASTPDIDKEEKREQ